VSGHVLVVDWSARTRPAPARPSRDSIWWCATWLGEPRYCRSQGEAEREILEALQGAPGRVLAGFDFCFALPGWAMARLGGWRALWTWLEKRDEPAASAAMELNRVLGGGAEGPFWGMRPGDRKPRPYLWTEFRECEWQWKRCGRHPKPVFQLRGAGAVGAQTLEGIPVVERLRRALGARVWPWEPCGEARVVLAEVWPAVLGRAPEWEEIPDRWQVATLARLLAGRALPHAPEAARLEGWVLAPPPRSGPRRIGYTDCKS
jgi:hypothetical protein